MHNNTNNKVAPRNGVASTPRPHSKRFPAYGKQLMAMRVAEQVPPNSVVVGFDWDLGKAFPRIVIADDVPIYATDFRFLAGLDVMIVYREKHANSVLELATEILKVNPRSLLAFHVEQSKNTILKNMAGEVKL